MSDEEQVQVLSAARATLLASRADARARQALTNVKTLSDNTWTKSDHERFEHLVAQDRARDSRWVRRMVVLTTLAVVVALGVLTFFISVEETRRARVDAELLRIQQASVLQCEARNEQLEQQRGVYLTFAAIEQRPESVQSREIADAKSEAYQMAAASLPEAYDCELFSRSELALPPANETEVNSDFFLDSSFAEVLRSD